jgi:hypothetical protein
MVRTPEAPRTIISFTGFYAFAFTR